MGRRCEAFLRVLEILLKLLAIVLELLKIKRASSEKKPTHQ